MANECGSALRQDRRNCTIQRIKLTTCIKIHATFETHTHHTYTNTRRRWSGTKCASTCAFCNVYHTKVSRVCRLHSAGAYSTCKLSIVSVQHLMQLHTPFEFTGATATASCAGVLAWSSNRSECTAYDTHVHTCTHTHTRLHLLRVCQSRSFYATEAGRAHFRDQLTSIRCALSVEF